jgi:hypothetical protein
MRGRLLSSGPLVDGRTVSPASYHPSGGWAPIPKFSTSVPPGHWSGKNALPSLPPLLAIRPDLMPPEHFWCANRVRYLVPKLVGRVDFSISKNSSSGTCQSEPFACRSRDKVNRLRRLRQLPSAKRYGHRSRSKAAQRVVRTGMQAGLALFATLLIATIRLMSTHPLL